MASAQDPWCCRLGWHACTCFGDLACCWITCPPSAPPLPLGGLLWSSPTCPACNGLLPAAGQGPAPLAHPAPGRVPNPAAARQRRPGRPPVPPRWRDGGRALGGGCCWGGPGPCPDIWRGCQWRVGCWCCCRGPCWWGHGSVLRAAQRPQHDGNVGLAANGVLTVRAAQVGAGVVCGASL